MLVNCLIGQHLKAPRAVPIRAGPTTGMPTVILALDMAPPAQQAAPSCSRSGSAGGAFTPALLAVYAPPHVDTRGGQEAMRCLRRPTVPFHRGWSRVNLNHRPHLYRVVSAMAWGIGQFSDCAAHERKHQRGHRLSPSARSAPQKQHDKNDDSDEDNRPNADIHDESSLPLSHPGFPAFRVENCPDRARRDCMGSPGSRAFCARWRRSVKCARLDREITS